MREIGRRNHHHVNILQSQEFAEAGECPRLASKCTLDPRHRFAQVDSPNIADCGNLHVLVARQADDLREQHRAAVAHAEELGMRRAALVDAPPAANGFAILVRATSDARPMLHTAGEPAPRNY